VKRIWAAGVLLTLAACGSPDPVSQDAGPAAPANVGPRVAPTAAMGEQTFKRCVACHTIDKGGRNGIGPNLHGVVGRAVGSVPNFGYSSAMMAKGGVWDAAALNIYLKAPRQAIPGNRMSFAGIPDAAEREALILYLTEQR
jgi:cytochrome c